MLFNALLLTWKIKRKKRGSNPSWVNKYLYQLKTISIILDFRIIGKNYCSIAKSEPEIQNQRRKKQVTKKNIKKKKNANWKRITANDDVQNDNAEVNDGEDIQNNDPDIIENEVEELFDTIETGEPNLPVIESSDAGSNDEEIDNDVEHAEIQNKVVVEGDELEIGSEVTIDGSGKKISNPDTWKCNVRKRKRNCGEAYIAKSGKELRCMSSQTAAADSNAMKMCQMMCGSRSMSSSGI